MLRKRNDHLLPFNGRPRSFSGGEDDCDLFDQNKLDTLARANSKESVEAPQNKVKDDGSRSPSPSRAVTKRRHRMPSSSPLSRTAMKQRRRSMGDFPMHLPSADELSDSRSSLRSDPSTGQPIVEEEEEEYEPVYEKELGKVNFVNGQYVSSDKQEHSDPSAEAEDRSHDEMGGTSHSQSEDDVVSHTTPGEQVWPHETKDDDVDLPRTRYAQIMPEEESFAGAYSVLRPTRVKSNDIGVFVLGNTAAMLPIPAAILTDDNADIVIGTNTECSSPYREVGRCTLTYLSERVMVIP